MLGKIKTKDLRMAAGSYICNDPGGMDLISDQPLALTFVFPIHFRKSGTKRLRWDALSLKELQLASKDPEYAKEFKDMVWKQTLAKYPLMTWKAKSMLAGYKDIDGVEIPDDPNYHTIVVTNSCDCLGAVALFYPGALEKISRRFGGDSFYIFAPEAERAYCISKRDTDRIKDPHLEAELNQMCADLYHKKYAETMSTGLVLAPGLAYYDAKTKTLGRLYGEEKPFVLYDITGHKAGKQVDNGRMASPRGEEYIPAINRYKDKDIPLNTKYKNTRMPLDGFNLGTLVIDGQYEGRDVR